MDQYERGVHKAAVDKRRPGALHLGAVTIYELPLISLYVRVCVCVLLMCLFVLSAHRTYENNK